MICFFVVCVHGDIRQRATNEIGVRMHMSKNRSLGLNPVIIRGLVSRTRLIGERPWDSTRVINFQTS
jgi:hypothetical protein